MKKVVQLCFLFAAILFAQSQVSLSKPSYFKTELDSLLENQIITSLDSLYQDIADFDLSNQYLTPKHRELTKLVLKRYFISSIKRQKKFLNDYKLELLNLYRIQEGKFFVTVVVTNKKSSEINLIINLIAHPTNGKFTFSCPLKYHTRFWKRHTIGDITYHYRDTLNLINAQKFDSKNSEISKKLGLTPDEFDFYMCYNEQEVLRLLGIQYLFNRNGQTRNGFGVYTKTICSLMNNEDFSHDVFHYYSGKINKVENRNWITEEGIAYLWGNAYYTDANGEMISHQRLISELRNHLILNPNTELLQLFEQNTKIFKHIAPEISVRSTIAGVLALEVERKTGSEGISKLINAGRKNGVENFLRATHALLGINKTNFNRRVKKLLEHYPSEK